MNANANRFSENRSTSRGHGLLRAGSFATVAALVIGASAAGWHPAHDLGDPGALEPTFEQALVPAAASGDETPAIAATPAAAPVDRAAPAPASDTEDTSLQIWPGQSAG